MIWRRIAPYLAGWALFWLGAARFYVLADRLGSTAYAILGVIALAAALAQYLAYRRG